MRYSGLRKTSGGSSDVGEFVLSKRVVLLAFCSLIKVIREVPKSDELELIHSDVAGVESCLVALNVSWE